MKEKHIEMEIEVLKENPSYNASTEELIDTNVTSARKSLQTLHQRIEESGKKVTELLRAEIAKSEKTKNRTEEGLSTASIQHKEVIKLKGELSYVALPQTKHIYKAILSPLLFDNYKFWAQLPQSGSPLIGFIIASAENAGFLDAVSVNLFKHDVIVYFPRLYSLVEQLSLLKVTESQFIEIETYICKNVIGQDQTTIEQVKAIFKAFLKAPIVIPVNTPSVIPVNNSGKVSSSSRLPNSYNGGGGPSAPNTSEYLGSPQFINNKQQLPDTTISVPSSSYALWMKIVSGFIMALGIVAVVLAFTTLNAATLGTAGVVVAAVGAASILAGGYGLFRYNSLLPTTSVISTNSMVPNSSI